MDKLIIMKSIKNVNGRIYTTKKKYNKIEIDMKYPYNDNIIYNVIREVYK